MLLLAPMEGLLDFSLRDILTRAGGIDRCVSEFVRVTNTLLPERVFYRIAPELLHGGCTPAGVPVRVQLLGCDPVCLAENAGRLASLGPAGIDLNFGCPAKVVNRHGGGAALLETPERIAQIVEAVRRAVPADMPVSAKMRLGMRDTDLAVTCAQAIEASGACELVVHGRTQVQGYKPPAYWDEIGRVRASVSIPVIANGEIWSVADAQRCRMESGCMDLMLGRGMVADPGLALAIRSNPWEDQPPLSWLAVQPLLYAFWGLTERLFEPRHRAGRIKQWLHMMGRRHPEAAALHAELRTENDPVMIEARLFGLRSALCSYG